LKESSDEKQVSKLLPKSKKYFFNPQ